MNESADVRRYQVESEQELQQLISNLNVKVPDRLTGRNKKQTESYIAARVLFAMRGKFTFPLCIEHGDRPDFRVIAVFKSIGIEIVEASSSNEIKKGLLRQRETDLTMHFVEPASPSEADKSAAELRAELAVEVEADQLGEVLGDGSVGSPVPEWVAAISHFANKKAAVCSAPGFGRFSENWLAIYDNWPMIMGEPKWKELTGALHARLVEDQVFETFDKVFVLSRGKILEFALDGSSMLDDTDTRPKPSGARRFIWWLQERWYTSRVQSW